MSAAPALLRWIRSRHPGVSRRQRSSSAGAEAREGEVVRAAMSGKFAGWATGLKSYGPRLVHPGLAPGVSACTGSRGSTDPGRKPGDHRDPRLPRDYLPEQVSHYKPHIRRALGEPSHIPGEPVRPVADQHAYRYALGPERALLGGADAVEHVHLRSEEHTSELQSQSNLVCR